MSDGRKYAALPDLDAAPDVYETPELTDDNSTPQTSTALRSESPASSYYDPDGDDSGGIDRHRLDPDEARSHFLPAQRNRRDLGSSSRINTKRRQYRDSSKRRHRDGFEVVEELGLSDEDEESLERKVARLRQEVTEVKSEFERRKTREANGEAKPQLDEVDTLKALSRALDGTDTSNSEGAASRIVKKISAASRTYDTSKARLSMTEPLDPSPDSAASTIIQTPIHQSAPLLSKVADFSARIAFLETALGISTLPLPAQDRPPPKAIFPLLDSLDRQIATLSLSTESSLDLTSRRVRQLTHDTQKLADARLAAKAAHEALLAETSDSGRPQAETVMPAISIEDPEQISRIKALYGTLPTIESLAPLLPAVLDRLRSLQTIHADAASASDLLAALERRQEEMADEMRSWREGLAAVEKAVEAGERTMAGNARVIENWVKELEGRVGELGG